MAKKKRKQSPLQKEWEKQYKLLKRRAKSWEKTHRVLYNDLPSKPKRITKESIEKVKNIRWKNIPEQKRQEYRQDYEEAYENRELPIPEDNIPPYTPPSEDDFYADDYNHDDYWWEDTPNEPANSREEIDAFIEETIESILDVSGIDRPNEAIRAILSTLLDNLRFSIGDDAFYEFLSDSSTVQALTEAAQTAMATSPTKGGNGTEKQQAQDAIAKFTFILNNKRPLSDTQARDLADVVESEGYYGGVSFDFED